MVTHSLYLGSDAEGITVISDISFYFTYFNSRYLSHVQSCLEDGDDAIFFLVIGAAFFKLFPAGKEKLNTSCFCNHYLCSPTDYYFVVHVLIYFRIMNIGHYFVNVYKTVSDKRAVSKMPQ